MLLSVVLSAALIAAPGPTDRQLAERAVLKPADVPRGWTAAELPPAVTCPAFAAARKAASGTARSKAFKRDSAEVQSSVYVFRDTAAAARRLRAMSGAGALRCYTDRLAGLMSRTSGVTVGKVERSALSVAPIGDQRAGARVSVEYTIEGIDAELFVDLAFVRAGRGIVLAAFVDVFTPFDDALRADLTAKQVSRLRPARRAGRAAAATDG